eukprot:scaffold179968_cov45-Attheya_sp.AAC.1
MNIVIFLFALLFALTAFSCDALAQSKQRQGAPAESRLQTNTGTDRRGIIFSAAALLTTIIGLQPSEASASANDGSAFVGTYSDPINHPGGTRTVRLLEGAKVGDYQLAEVAGGGGIGEPKSYVLPAVVIGNRAIVIDFTPKGGPRDFTGVLEGTSIKFLRDGNKWPRAQVKVKYEISFSTDT